MRNCEPKWGPSMHRNVHGQKSDHALLACTWKWRIRTEKSTPVKDFSCFSATGSKTTRAKFNAAVTSKLDELHYDLEDNATDMYTKICQAIRHAVESTLPTVARKKGIKRTVSARTQALYDLRTNMAGTKAQYKEIQKK